MHGLHTGPRCPIYTCGGESLRIVPLWRSLRIGRQNIDELAAEGPPSGTANTLTCPWCGNNQTIGLGRCTACNRSFSRIPRWSQTGRDHRLFTLRRLITAGVVLLAFVFVLWLNYPFLPDVGILLFNRPTTELSSTSASGQWSMAGGDIAQTKVIQGVDSPQQPAGQVLWSVPIGPSTRSGPIVSDGRVYVGGHFKIAAVDASTGATLWEQPTTGPVQSSLAAAGDLLFIGLLDHRFLTLDAATGETVREFKVGDFITSAPVVNQGIVYFGSWDNNVYALDAANGEPIWNYEATAPIGSPAAIRDGVLAVADRNGRVHLLNARTGQNRLVFRTPKSAHAGAVIANDLVYFAAGGRLYAIDATEKEIPGQYQFKQVWAQLWLWKVPGVPRPARQQGGRWRFSPDGADSSIVAAPAVTNDLLYAGDLQGRLYAVHPLTGEELWRFQGQGGIYASPIVVGGRVYIATQTGHVYALDGSTGQSIWELSLGSPINQPIAFADGRLYLRTFDGRLHTIE